MTRAAHERYMDQLRLAHTTCTDLMQEAVDREFRRAMDQGRGQVHAWAVEANYNVFSSGNPRGAAQAAFQEAIQMFAPTRTDVKEATDAVTGS